MSSEAKQPLNREQIAAVLAGRLERDWIVNLGVGIPVLACDFVDPDAGIVLSSENGLIGYGWHTPEGHEDLDVVTPGMQYVVLPPGAAIVHHADAFGLIRSGRVDCSVLGAYEVATDGSFANWTPHADGRSDLGGIGGAMDLTQGAKRVWLTMFHTTSEGAPRLVEGCTLPVTGGRPASLVVTDLAVIEVNERGFELLEHAPGYSAEEIQAVTGAPLAVSPSLRPMPV